jgi:pheganomycin biosynthesis PGM1-like protein
LTSNLAAHHAPGDDPDTIARFEALQQKLVPLWHSIQQFSQDAQTIVVVPSLNVDSSVQGVMLQAYEERYLFLLLLLRQARARVVYVTSQAIHPDVVDYYLGLLPGVIGSHAKKRLFLVSPLDGSPRPLTEKLLERPRLVEHIRSLVLDPDRAHLVPYNTTAIDRELAVRIGIPMYGADPKFFTLGTKSGARRIFAEEGVLHPLGAENLGTADHVVDAILEMRARKPTITGAVVKLNEGVSGEGNAVVDLSNMSGATDRSERAVVAERVRAMRFELADTSYGDYMAKLADRGGIVEERISGREFHSPSAQLRVTPIGMLEPLSTHDQLLGGPSGQMYFGCRFPANPGYAPAIMREAMKVGRRLMHEGVLGRFAVDFVTVRNDRDEWEVYAIEINLRKGGTTHPFLTLQFLTDGSYDADRAIFTTPRGEPKYFVATDHLRSPAYRVFTHEDLFDLVARHGLHFDQTRQKGVVFHMMNAIGEEGMVGLTAVGNTREEADAIYAKTIEALDNESILAGRASA